VLPSSVLLNQAESALLSSPESSHKIPQILEQLFEDLNSYAETSIPIDKSNSIEIKIFPLLPKYVPFTKLKRVVSSKTNETKTLTD